MSTSELAAQSHSPTKYASLAERMRRQIRSGELAPGERLSSQGRLKDEGVSQATAERAYALLEQEGLIVRRRGSGVYVAATGARKQRTQTGTIGFVQQDFTQHGRHPYWAHLLAGVQRASAAAGYHVMLIEHGVPAGKRWEKVDGVVMSEVNWPRALQQMPPFLPVVSLLHPVPDKNAVLLDETSAIRDALHHLWQLGHRRIAMLSQGGYGWRRESYRATLEELGIRADARWQRDSGVGEDWDNAVGMTGYGYQAMARWLAEDWKQLGCTALLAQNDDMAIGAIKALQDGGLRVPQDVSVIGFDGAGADEHFSPRLTTLQVPLREIGAVGVELLLRQMSGQASKPEIQLLAAALRIGASTAAHEVKL